MTSDNARIIERRFHLPVGEDALFVTLLSHAAPEAAETQPTWVFLHEALGSVGQWKGFPFELCRATGLDGVVYDRVGHGRSSPMRKPRDPGFYREEAEVSLQGLLRELNLRRPLLFGHSDGATIALMYASCFPDRTEGVVSEAAHVVIEDVTVAGIRGARELYATTDLRGKLSRYHAEKTDAVFSAWADTWLDPAMAEWDMLDDLGGIRCPLLVVQGDEDQYGTRQQVDLIVEHTSGPAEVLWLEGVGHVPHLQARQRVVADTARWCAARFG